jgi:hypothetical protein
VFDIDDIRKGEDGADGDTNCDVFMRPLLLLPTPPDNIDGDDDDNDDIYGDGDVNGNNDCNDDDNGDDDDGDDDGNNDIDGAGVPPIPSPPDIDDACDHCNGVTGTLVGAICDVCGDEVVVDDDCCK